MRDPAVDAERMRAATTAVMETLAKCGVDNDPIICLAVIGCLAGCISVATGHPENALERVIAAARGIIDGSLLD